MAVFMVSYEIQKRDDTLIYHTSRISIPQRFLLISVRHISERLPML